ncbi:hypothetical protein Sjap_010746 [Stephania japonica]|uniref:Uncharacterized protein n=1 Tax=Stephania japonica TaxID=461633 RepID=A0AAP0J9Y3_9MAGN
MCPIGPIPGPLMEPTGRSTDTSPRVKRRDSGSRQHCQARPPYDKAFLTESAKLIPLEHFRDRSWWHPFKIKLMRSLSHNFDTKLHLEKCA